MIEKHPFGRTGHESSRILFGAAALAAMRPARVEATLELLTAHGVNHIDTAASYGDSEKNLADWLSRNRDAVFLASKTRKRDGEGARSSLERSLERMRVDSLDLIQLHNLVDEEGWQQAMAPGGAVEALARARDEGLVRFLGVTGHGTFAPEMHRRSLEQFDFASVLCPYNFTMMRQPDYAADFDVLERLCQERGVALQTIKSLARRRWTEESERRFSWYEPLRDETAIRRAVHHVLSRPGLFLNSSSDGGLLEITLRAAADFDPADAPSDEALLADTREYGVQPLFERDISDGI